jgi:hypothetical protein
MICKEILAVCSEVHFCLNGATATSGPGYHIYRGSTITLRHTTVGGTLEIHTEHMNTLCEQKIEFISLILVVSIETTGM